jgi:hypothetical protein
MIRRQEAAHEPSANQFADPPFLIRRAGGVR